MRKSFTVILIILFTFTLSACRSSNGNDDNEGTTQTTNTENNGEVQIPDEEFELSGEYAIDITDLGMALTFYLKIDEENNFILSPSRDFLQDRGSGTVHELDGTYMFIYHDSTPEQSKTATFERNGHNLIFRSTLPYGSSNIMYEVEDEENPNIIHHLIADKMVYEEYYNTYLGFHTEGNENYETILTLEPGARYHYVSRYEDGEDIIEYEESGYFRVYNDIIGLKPDDEAELYGSITDDGGLEMMVKLTASTERSEHLLRVATTSEYAGVWYAYASGDDYEATATLEFDYFGGYTFTSDDGDGSYVDTGTFEVNDTAITFTSNEDGATPVVGTRENYMINVVFDLSETVTNVEWLFYDEDIQGTFSGHTMSEEGYLATLVLNPEGTYELLIVNENNNNEQLVSENGTFSITAGPMAYILTLTSSESNSSVGAIWSTGLNMTIEVNGTDFSFMLTK